MINRPKTKIVCTLGPATDTAEQIEALIESGMSVARLNLSHGELDYHTRLFKTVREVSARRNTPCGILVDVPGASTASAPWNRLRFPSTMATKLPSPAAM